MVLTVNTICKYNFFHPCANKCLFSIFRTPSSTAEIMQISAREHGPEDTEINLTIY